MIIIQIILIVGFTLFLFKVVADPSSYRLKAWTKLLASLFVMIAIIAVLVPDVTTLLAKRVGVTRGADLLLYLLTMAFIFTILSNYIQEKKLQGKLVLLARKVALLEANLNDAERNLTNKSNKK